MKRLFVCLFVVFSLMLTPVVHAAGFSCPDTGCTMAEQTSKEKKQDDGKLAGVGHHCCCNHIVDRAPLKVADSLTEISSAFIPGKQDDLASITVGPLLEPPSLA